MVGVTVISVREEDGGWDYHESKRGGRWVGL